MRTATEKLLTYALGRGVEYYDYPTIRAIAREAARDNYRISSLILAIVKSTPFQMRRAVGVMIIINQTLPRRTFLRGLGATMALPLLDSMVPPLSALAQRRRRPPMRLGYVYTPNGIIGACDKSPRPFMWTPKTVGANSSSARR